MTLQDVVPTPVRFEHRETGFGLGTATPRLSWQLPSAPPGFAATAAELELTDLDTREVTAARVESAEQVLVRWPFPPLPARARAAVRVRVAAGADHTAWSEPAQLETTLLDAADWTARFVSPRAIGRIGDPAPVLCADVDLPDGIVRARLHVTALGLHVTTINGRRATDEELAPGWTAYADRLRFRTHDVTELVRAGRNALEILLGNGWYRGRLGWGGRRAHYGDRLAALAQLEVTAADGTVTTFGTDGTWTARPSGVLADDLYDGQTTDLRSGPDGPADPVDVLDEDLGRLVAPLGPPVRAVATVPAVAVTRSPSGNQLVDFGENLVGWVRLRVRGGAPGQEVTIRHAEVLERGELGVRPLRSAQATDGWLLAGGAEEVLEPSLTFHGFRYAEITGVDVTAADVEAVVLSSDLRPTGTFTCSEPDVVRLHENVVRSMRGNFVDVPTDCPQRDERLGWTGDIQVFAPTATFVADSAGFLASWLRDLAADQHADGSVPFVVPDVLRDPGPAAAAWGDAATIVPWTLYERYGDAGVLADQFDSMRAWVDRQAQLAGEDHVWAGGFQFGDWLDPDAPPEAPWAAKADPDLVASAHLVRSAEIVADAARVLGRDADARRYGDLAAVARAAFAREYVTPRGRLLSDAPTAYALALVWDLVPEPEQRAAAGRRLADLVRGGGFRIGTGFVGTPLICDALVRAGEPAVAYRMLLERACPSWLYPVSMGATTIWERWDSMLPDGSINPGEMTSFNHYALGAVADWLHRTVAGLAPAAPGYREIVVAPLPGGGLTSAAATHETPYGTAAVAWERADGTFRLEVQVPVGAHATVHVPGADGPQRVGHGSHRWEVADPTPAPRPLRTVRDAVDDAALWADVTAAAAEFGMDEASAPIDIRIGRFLDRPVSELAPALAPPGLVPHAEQVHKRVAEILARRGAGG
ncbi:family 78 glycoside hydrolase catalytic domain [Pseudonocardia nigra]|uniref:family 78 glycoside hydrolase catalytic domain n=1 Tax=Pseudonocardia nigra TaxID=1921578 RepID=UPI0027E2BF9B|nr:family 78 glycoside hydrolase catalytic domain [Pseudonocardia nigra]